LAFIIKKGTFNQTQVKVMLDDYLTPNQKQNKMVAQLSLGDKWEAIGEARGKKIGEARGKEIGEKQKARLTVLRGYFRGQEADLLADICGLPLQEVLDLKIAYEAVKKALQDNKINTMALSNSTRLSEYEVKYVIECLERF
jgi:hypothetical protein